MDQNRETRNLILAMMEDCKKDPLARKHNLIFNIMSDETNIKFMLREGEHVPVFVIR